MENDPDVIALLFAVPQSPGARSTLALPGNASKLICCPNTHAQPTAGHGVSDSDHEDDDDDGTASQASVDSSSTASQALELRFSQTRGHQAGFVIGRDPRCDVVLPFSSMLRGLSSCHGIITFDDQRRLIFKDIRAPGRGDGSAVTYHGDGRAKRRHFTWLLSGCRQTRRKDITIALHDNLVFRLFIPDRDLHSKDYRERVDRFLLGTEVIPSNMNVEPQYGGGGGGDASMAPSGTQTPATGSILLEVPNGMLGNGAFGTVSHVWDVSTGEEFAAKVPLNIQEYDRAEWDREIELMGLVDHVHIVKLLRHRKAPYHWLLLEYAQLGNLRGQQNRRPFSEYECAQLLQQCALGLAHMHCGRRQPLIHRDLAPNNILVRSRDPLHVQLSDFGLSKAVDDYAITMVGTKPYRAPEMLRRQRYGPNVDLWSLGLIVFQMVWPDCPKWSYTYDLDVLRWCDDVAQAARAALQSPNCNLLVRLIAEKMLCLDPKQRGPVATLCHLATDVVDLYERQAPTAGHPGDRDESEDESEAEKTSRPADADRLTARPTQSLAPAPSSRTLKRRRAPSTSSVISARQYKQPRQVPSTSSPLLPTEPPRSSGSVSPIGSKTFQIWDSDWLKNSMAVGSEVAAMGRETPSGWSDEPSMTSARRTTAQPVGSDAVQRNQGG